MANYTFSKTKRGCLSLDFHDYDYWESVEEILELLKCTFNVKLIKELDGPATRYRKIEIEDIFLNLHYTSYGSFLDAEDKRGNELLRKIKTMLEKTDINDLDNGTD